MKIARSLTTVLCAGLLSLAAYGGARAADEGVTIDAIKKAGVLRIGTWLQYEPEMYKDLKTGEIKGFWIEMARKMATDLGVKLEIVDSDWDGLIPGLQAGKFEIVQTVTTGVGAKTMDVDPATHKAYLPTFEFEAQQPGATGRPTAKAGSFMIVVVGRH